MGPGTGENANCRCGAGGAGGAGVEFPVFCSGSSLGRFASFPFSPRGAGAPRQCIALRQDRTST